MTFFDGKYIKYFIIFNTRLFISGQQKFVMQKTAINYQFVDKYFNTFFVILYELAFDEMHLLSLIF